MTFISQIIQQHPDAGYWHQQYPWFSVGHLVNTANKKDTPAFKESAQKAAVFFNDIPRLHWLVYQQDVDTAAILALLDKTGKAEEQPTIIKKPKSKIDTESGITETNSTIVKENTQDEIENQISENEPVTIAESKIKQPDHITIAEAMSESEALEPAITNTPAENNGIIHQPEILIAENQEPLLEAETEKLNKKSEHPELAPEELEVDDSEADESEMDESDLIPLPTSMLSESLAQAADKFKNAPVDEDYLVFKTAYQHTIDYFASQGIKLDGEPAKDDRFGQQLKTFTSWLRQMKRLPDAPVAEADPLVESHAAHSLQKDDVLTEPMADVLLKQGKNNQAIYVLEKLRLLHPQKSHYFAARIDQIKHS